MKNYFSIFRLRAQLHSLSRERDQGLIHLGKRVFHLFRDKEMEREDLQENVQEILSIEDEIDHVRETLHRELGEPPRKQCQSCGKYIDADAKYCSFCGSLQERGKSE